jgi:hypothetical protein
MRPDVRNSAEQVAGRRPVRIAVMIPAGPRDDIADTLASVVRYTDPSRVIVIMDDTAGPEAAGRGLTAESADIEIITSRPARPGTQGGLWVKMAPAYRWLLAKYQPGIVLRLDADAVMLGSGLEAAAEDAFRRHPEAGLLGSYRVGADGGQRDFHPVARQLRAETGPLGLRHPRLRAGLRRYVSLARGGGYVEGEHVLGCAFLLRGGALQGIHRAGGFSTPWLEASRLGDDHIMSLMTVAAGYKIADFGGPADPIAVKWEELPAHPAELLARGKLVTHSVRSWGDLTERQIRDIFAAARAVPSRVGHRLWPGSST